LRRERDEQNGTEILQLSLRRGAGEEGRTLLFLFSRGERERRERE